LRVLVLFAHPVETSFAAALHTKVVEASRAKGRKVDDCDLR
jgi:putative NADPH-quinone reductase